MLYTLEPFGQLDTTSLEDYYETEITLDGATVELDLNFDSTTADSAILNRVADFIKRIPSLLPANLQAIRADYENGDTVKEYIHHHLDMSDDFKLPDTTKNLSNEERLLAALHLRRIGLYPENDDHFAIFDYGLDEELTQYLVVLFVNEDGSLDEMTMES